MARARAESDERAVVSTEISLTSLVTPSCTCIQILEQLVLLSKGHDFIIKEEGTTTQYIKYPNFRSCLMQLVHDCWNAFNTADRNMNEVLRHVEKLPEAFESVYEILTEGEDDDIECLLPTDLQNIKSRSSKCSEYTRQCENAVVNVMKLIDEIHNLCSTKDQVLMVKEQENEVTKEMLQNMTRMLAEDKQQIQIEKRKYEASIKAAQTHYEKAVDNLPSDMMLAASMMTSIVQEVLPALPMLACYNGISSATDHLVAATQSYVLLRGRSQETPGAAPSNPVQGGSGSTQQTEGPQDTYQVCLEKLRLISFTMLQWIDNNTLRGTDGPNGCVSVLFNLEQMPAQNEQNIAIQAMVAEVLNICSKVRELVGGLPNEAREAEIISEIRAFQVKVQNLTTLHHAQVALPGAVAAAESVGQTIQSNMGLLIEARQKEAAMAERRLTAQEKRYDKLRQDQRENAKKMLEVVNKLSKINTSTISVGELRKTLVEAMRLFVLIREQWGMLTQFFEFLTAMIANEMDEEVAHFRSTVEGVKGKNIEKLKKKRLDKTMKEVDACIKRTKKVASFYTTVSGRYLMPSLNHIFQIEATAEGRTPLQCQVMQTELQNNYSRSLAEIIELAENMAIDEAKITVIEDSKKKD